ncbi:phage terminase large subunit, partial [Escherichia coli]|nr:phage terminase large subunit [Escherichia coli]
LIQGITLAGCFFDEVALMPQSFVNQATARCSVEGSKLWFNCNPAGPYHWFKLEYLDKLTEKRMAHLHFTMDDNLSLSERVKERYKRMYSG